ncbi:HAD family hydrolase [Kineococcus rhizosphaerae]|uniref:HAD superfamily hydrolase (TIGR01484 family) n=1 Tax=Kineococcus rhizosphaerae TaxID=559628 RepID=A0A2T0R2Q0_9ACTN|nr:HAD family hydrolase [Kineococcus rhizosphaerae]PRY14064.1 HAD superfamily hydrolase (TIGR01484 family) [Kineococcus rhizosphaerae]
MSLEGLLVALDVDGTVVDLDESLSDRVRDAVHRVAGSGAHVVVATGRSLHGTLPVLQRLGLHDGFAVCSNGAVTVQLDPAEPEGYRVVSLHTFDPSGVAELLRENLPTGLFAVEVLGRGYKLTAPFPDGELTGEMTVVPFDELFAEPVMRVIIRSPEHTSAEFSRLVDEVGLKGVAYSVGWTAWLDLAPDGVTKASALEEVRMRLDVERERTVAVGDGRNDVEMLRWAGRGVAMGNAPDEVKAAADAVTGSVEDDGLAEVLEALTRSAV